jgi:two-component system, sensor histidine kinase
MTVLLEGWGCRVIAAATGHEAEIALVRDNTMLHAILADYRLPDGEDGLTLLRRLKPRHPFARAILISGDIDPELLRKAEQAGIPMLHKPLRPARLRAMLGSIWRGRRVEAAE